MISRLIAVSLTVCYMLATTYSAVIPWNSNGGDGATGVAGGSEANEPDILINETNINQETTEPVDPPKYIQNLFLNFTNHSSPLEYNTIRSFENIGQGDCEGDIYTFKFNTSAIMKSELVIKSELRVYLEITSELKGHVDVSLLFLNKTKINTRTLNTSSQWLEFTVSPAIENWLRNDVNGRQGFKIMLKPNDVDVAQVCSSTVRLRTDRSDEYLPLLIVYSYETEQSQSSFIQMIEKTMAKETQVSPPNSPDTEGGIRISRSVGQYCQKTTLTLDILWLNANIFSPFGRTMLAPPTLNINICGGQCSGVSILSTHSALLSLATKGTPKSKNMTNVCAPLEYQAVQVIMKDGPTTYVIENLENISVKQCGCITVDRSISCNNR